MKLLTGFCPDLINYIALIDMNRRVRLDTLLVERELAQTRARAQALVLAGQVKVDGTVTTKAGTSVSDNAEITLLEPDHPYVSRGGIKLENALKKFQITVTDRSALDVGASTGGFTEVLLINGASHVVALDVGHGQLAWKIRTNTRVSVIEGLNARSLEPHMLPTGFQKVDVVTIDVSFISLKLILGQVLELLKPTGDVIALVKPQFEARREEVQKRGLITDPEVHTRVIEEITAAAGKIGLQRIAMATSPIKGSAGNKEFFLHLRKRFDGTDYSRKRTHD